MCTECEVFHSNLACPCFGSVVPGRSVVLHHKNSSLWSVGRITFRDSTGQPFFYGIKEFQLFDVILKGRSLCCHWTNLKAGEPQACSSLHNQSLISHTCQSWTASLHSTWNAGFLLKKKKNNQDCLFSVIQVCTTHDQSHGFASGFVVLIAIPGGQELISKLHVLGCTTAMYKEIITE